MKNGSTVNFRYVAQQGKQTEDSKSNLLSATYDWIIVDQMEDPEFSHKDFMDLMGRLRGNTEYSGDDPSMPRVGPRWFMATLNPTGIGAIVRSSSHSMTSSWSDQRQAAV